MLEETNPPEIVERLEVNKVNIEVWRKLSQHYLWWPFQNLILKSQNLTCNLIDALHKATKVIDPKELEDIIKSSLKRCADSAIMLRNINHDLLSLRRESIA